LKEQEERFNDVMKLSYADRLKVFRNEWTEMYHLRDGDASATKQMRVALETGVDPNVQNAAERINFFSQKPGPEHLDELIRTQTTTSLDRFMKLVEQIDEMKSVIDQMEPAALRALAAVKQNDFLRDLREGRYDPAADAALVKTMYEKEQAEQSEQTQNESTTPTTETKSDEPKTETTETKSDVVETKSDETKTDQPAAAETHVQTKLDEIKTETPLETKSDETKSEPVVAPAVAPLEVETGGAGGAGVEIKMDASAGGIPATVSA
jgi:hypothetical protein